VKFEAAKILIVDDESHICEIISRWLTAEGYICKTVTDGESAIDILNQESFDLVIADIMMPGMSGVDLLTFIKSRYSDIAVLMLTAVDDCETGAITLDLGAYGHMFKPFDKRDILLSVFNALERRRLSLANEEYQRTLEKQLAEHTAAMKEREREMINLLLTTLSIKTDETLAHCKRVGNYAAALARYLRWDLQAVEVLRLAATLHDIGKLGIPDNVLLKPAELTFQEFEVVKTHTKIGARILGSSRLPIIRLAREISLSHHEKWDGSGYPSGLRGEAIPESGRIVAIVDTYDTLTQHKAHRPAFSEDKALAIMDAYKEKLFDPRIYDYFLTLLPAMQKIRLAGREDESDYGRDFER
jgi:putative two-component system response regulator